MQPKSQPKTEARHEAAPDFPPDLFADNLKQKRPARVTISHASEEIFRFLTDPDHYPRFLDEAGPIQITKASHDVIVWQAGDKGFGAFALHPAAGGRGTIVTFKMQMTGEWSGTVARLVGKDSDTRAAVALRKLKAYIETGEVPTVEGQSSGREELKTHH